MLATRTRLPDAGWVELEHDSELTLVTHVDCAMKMAATALQVMRDGVPDEHLRQMVLTTIAVRDPTRIHQCLQMGLQDPRRRV